MVKILLILACGIISSSVAFAKEPAIGWYPPEYANLTVDNLAAIRAGIEKAARLDVSDEEFKAGLAEARWLLARIAAINWPEKERAEVSHLVAGFAKTAFSADYYKRSEAHQEVSWLAYQTLETLWAIDTGKAAETSMELWPALSESRDELYSGMRIVVLRKAQAGFRNNAVNSMMIRLAALPNTEMSASEQRLLERFMLLRKLWEINDEGQAWLVLWEKYPSEGLTHLLTREAMRQWGAIYGLFSEVYGKPNPAVTLALAGREDNKPRQYIFFYCTALALNGIGAEKLTAEHRKTAASLLELSDKFRAENRAELALADNKQAYDFVIAELSVLRLNLEKAQAQSSDAPRREE